MALLGLIVIPKRSYNPVMTPDMTALDIPKYPAERRAWVIFELKKRKTNLSRIADALKITRQSVYGAFSEPSVRVEMAVAEALGMTAQQLFPERFDHNGVRIPHTRPDNISLGRAAGDSQNERHTQTETGRAA